MQPIVPLRACGVSREAYSTRLYLDINQLDLSYCTVRLDDEVFPVIGR